MEYHLEVCDEECTSSDYYNYWLWITGLMGGTLIIEQVFSLMGIGTLMLIAIQTRDVPLVCGITVVISAIFCLVQLLVDVLYIIFDPRLAVKIEK